MIGQQELTFEDYIAILRRRWLWIAGLAVIGAGLGYGLAHFLPKRFTSKTVVLVEQPTVPGDYVRPVVSSNTSQRLAAMQQQILSRTRLEPIIRQFELDRREINPVPMESLVARLQESIEITPISPMALTQSNGLPGFTISVTFDDPQLAQQICSTITSMFMEENLQLRQQQAEGTVQFLSRQLDEAKKNLDEQDARLAAFQRRNLGSLPDEESRNMNLLMGLTSQLEAVTQALNRAQQDKAFAESTLAQQLTAWQTSQSEQNPQAYESQLAALEAQLIALQTKYTSDHPDVIRAKNDIEAMKAKIAESDAQKAPPEEEEPGTTPIEPAQIQALRAQIHQLDQMIQERTAQEERLQQQIEVYQARVQSSPVIEQEYKELTRDYQTALDFYNDLLRKRVDSAMATDLERRQQGEQFRVLDPANLPDAPSFPNKIYFTGGGTAAGLALSIGLVALFEIRDTSLRNEKDVESLLQLPVLAMIPETSDKPKKSSTRVVLRI